MPACGSICSQSFVFGSFQGLLDGSDVLQLSDDPAAQFHLGKRISLAANGVYALLVPPVLVLQV